MKGQFTTPIEEVLSICPGSTRLVVVLAHVSLSLISTHMDSADGPASGNLGHILLLLSKIHILSCKYKSFVIIFLNMLQKNKSKHQD